MVDPLAVATLGHQSRGTPDNAALCIATLGWICIATAPATSPQPPTPTVVRIGGGGGGGHPLPYLPPPSYTDSELRGQVDADLVGEGEEHPQYISARALAAAIAVAIEGGGAPRRVAASIALSAEDGAPDDEEP